MKQYEAVIHVMQENGGYATLGYLYQKVSNVPGVTWNTKTPFKSINRIVQTHDVFFKIKPGLWALTEYRETLPNHVLGLMESGDIKSKINEAYNHSYYQGLLLEVGNLENFLTYVPAQDKNKQYINTTLGDVATRKDMPPFASLNVLSRARTIDVIWFNHRHMPESVFEVEHSTDMQNSLAKFVDLQDFNIKFVIVADKARENLFEKRLTFEAFAAIKSRVQFLSYDQLSSRHTRTIEYYESRKDSGI